MRYPKPNARAGFALAGVAAAAGLITGFVVRARGRQVVAMAAEPLLGDWLDVIKTQHLEALEVAEKLEETKPRATARRAALLTKLRLMLTRHAVEEENVLYPALRVAAGAAEAHALAGEHADVKAALYELELMAADDAAFKPRVRALREQMEAHMLREETEIFPALRQRLSPEEDAALTAMLHREGRLIT